jgi:acetyl esterase/lipase
MEALMNPARFYLGPNQYQKLCKHPYASPLFANSFENLPPILLQYGSEETMSGEVRAVIKRLKTCKHTESRYEEYEVKLSFVQYIQFVCLQFQHRT